LKHREKGRGKEGGGGYRNHKPHKTARGGTLRGKLSKKDFERHCSPNLCTRIESKEGLGGA